MKDPELKPLSQAKGDECRALIANLKATKDYDSGALLSLIEDEYDTFQTVFERNGMKGVKDFDGNVVVPAMFDDIVESYPASCYDRLIPVIKDGKAGLVAPDGSGKVIVGFDYDSINAVSYGYMCQRGVLKGMLAHDGHVLIPCEMDVIYEAFNGLIAFEKDGKRGYWYDGVLSEEFYEEDFIDTCDLLCVYRIEDGKKVCGYLDKEGHFTTEMEEAWFGIF